MTKCSSHILRQRAHVHTTATLNLVECSLKRDLNNQINLQHPADGECMFNMSNICIKINKSIIQINSSIVETIKTLEHEPVKRTG